MTTVVLGLGSNSNYKNMLPLEILAAASARLERILEGAIFSSVYETRPMYYEAQENFFNLIVCGSVSETVSPLDLLETVNAIEAEFGRNRSEEQRFGPRPLDIDIEEFGVVKMNENRLVLPHPRMSERQFVLVPLLEILEKSADFNKKEEIRKIVGRLPDQGVRKCSCEVQQRFSRLVKEYFQSQSLKF